MNGCTYNSSFDITEPDAITVTVDETGVTCTGLDNGIINITNISGGVGPYTVLLDGELNSDLLIDSLASGDYTLEIIDSELCSIIEVITILDGTADVLADYTLIYDITEGDSVLLEGELFEDNLTFEWSMDSSLNCNDCAEPMATPSTTTIYNLTITNDAGCEQIISVTVNVITVQINSTLTNIFSPNGDGMNDDFLVSLRSESIYKGNYRGINMVNRFQLFLNNKAFFFIFISKQKD